jgi:hypothetical protein
MQIVVGALSVVLLVLVAWVTAAIWHHRAYYGLDQSAGPAAHTKTNVDLLFTYIYSLAVIVGFGATLIQLRRGHLDSLIEDKWQRSEFVAQEFRMFNTDRSVLNFKAILEAIAYDAPPRLQLELVDPSDPNSEKNGVPQRVELTVSMQDLMNAYTPDHHEHLTDVERDLPLPGDSTWSPVAVKIAGETDQFMNYLVNFSKLYRQGILLYEDLHAYLYYWFEIIFPDSKKAAQASCRTQILRRQLQRFLKVYYNGQTDERWEEGQCAFICAILSHKGEAFTDESDFLTERLYENTFGKVDIDPSWSGSGKGKQYP